jgi:hypothetical protein
MEAILLYCSACEDEALDGNIACLVDQDVECSLGFGHKSENRMELGTLTGCTEYLQERRSISVDCDRIIVQPASTYTTATNRENFGTAKGKVTSRRHRYFALTQKAMQMVVHWARTETQLQSKGIKSFVFLAAQYIMMRQDSVAAPAALLPCFS